MQILRRMDHGILHAYVRLGPLASHLTMTSPGIGGLAAIMFLPR
jgi:hypothetical protein